MKVIYAQLSLQLLMKKYSFKRTKEERWPIASLKWSPVSPCTISWQPYKKFITSLLTREDVLKFRKKLSLIYTLGIFCKFEGIKSSNLHLWLNIRVNFIIWRQKPALMSPDTWSFAWQFSESPNIVERITRLANPLPGYYSPVRSNLCRTSTAADWNPFPECYPFRRLLMQQFERAEGWQRVRDDLGMTCYYSCQEESENGKG